MKNAGFSPTNLLLFVSGILILGSFAIFSHLSTLTNGIEEERKDEPLSLNTFYPPQGDNVMETNANIKEIVDSIRDNIDGFTEQYETEEAHSRYYGAKPLYKTKVNISTGLYYRADQLSFFVVPKDTSKQSNCNLINYKIALETIDMRLLQPGESYNANNELTNKKNYCTGRGEVNFLFYGGVCGMTSQLFRVSLINPNISVVQRHNHSQWFVQYYGENVQGDDAAIYQTSKQFEIKNDSDKEIYFRVMWKDNMTYLVGVMRKNNKWVDIKKDYLHARGVDLFRLVGEGSGIISEEVWRSVYVNKNYELR